MRTRAHCYACHKFEFLDKHHIKTRGSGGTDEDENLVNLCRACHTKIHTIGAVRFLRRYPTLAKFVSLNGWEIKTEFGIEKLRREK